MSTFETSETLDARFNAKVDRLRCRRGVGVTRARVETRETRDFAGLESETHGLLSGIKDGVRLLTAIRLTVSRAVRIRRVKFCIEYLWIGYTEGTLLSREYLVPSSVEVEDDVYEQLCFGYFQIGERK